MARFRITGERRRIVLRCIWLDCPRFNEAKAIYYGIGSRECRFCGGTMAQASREVVAGHAVKMIFHMANALAERLAGGLRLADRGENQADEIVRLLLNTEEGIDDE